MASPIVLTILPSPNPPATNTVGKTFAADYAKLASPNFTEIDRKIIQIVSLVHSVSSSADYRSSLSSLVADAEVYTRGISNIDLDVAYTATHWSLGFSTDANLTTDPIAILKEGQQFRAYGKRRLDRIIAYLACCGPV